MTETTGSLRDLLRNLAQEAHIAISNGNTDAAFKCIEAAHNILLAVRAGESTLTVDDA